MHAVGFTEQMAQSLHKQAVAILVRNALQLSLVGA